MINLNEKDINAFIYPPSCYYGQATPENLAFNATLQKFAQEISYIGGLEASGQISSEEAFKAVQERWKQLENAKVTLTIASNAHN